MSLSTLLPNISSSTFSSDNPEAYTNFKTPFFEISIGLPGSKEVIPLPDQLVRLVQKVEIVESYASDTCNVEYFTIVFAEGSREPLSTEEGFDSSGLYNTDSLPGNTLTNNSGFLLDLRFTTKNGIQGITSLSPSEETDQISAANTASQVSSTLTAALDPLATITSANPVTIKANSSPTYLFQEGNIVMIKWGYRESDQVRIIANPILMTQSDFPESGQPTTTLICQSPVALLDQIAPPNGVSLKKPTGGNINEIGEFIVDYEDIRTTEYLLDICETHGIFPRISKDILNDLLDKNASKVWHAGQSLMEFLRHLAASSNCKFRIYIDPNSNYQYTLEFIRNVDIMSQSSIPVSMDSLLTYKGIGSILKSFNVRADFAGLPSIAQVGIDSSGKSQASATGDGGDQTVLFSQNNTIVNYDPTNKSAVAASVVSNGFTGDQSNIKVTTNKVNVNPAVDSPQVLSDSALAAFARCGNKQIAVEFKTLGYPLLMAGQIVKFSNVGNRYSVNYHVQTVTHTHDSTGYNCTGTALGFNLGGPIGIQPSSPTNYDEKPQEVGVSLFALGTSGISQPPVDLVSDSRNNRFVTA